MRYWILLPALLCTDSATAENLRGALDHAWTLSPQAQSAEARRTESDAQAIAASSLMPSAPAVILGHRSDRLNNNIGQREWEAGVALPIWLPGQRDARQRQAQTGKTGVEANIRALRLKLAGELREAIWQVRQVEVQNRLHEQRAQTAWKLAEEVAKRVHAGELAKTDLNLAQNEWRTAQTAVLHSRNLLLQAQQAYATFTGTMVLPDDIQEKAQPTPLQEDHPLLEEARQSIEAAQAQLRVANESHRDNPEIELSTRRERASLNDPYTGTVAISLRLPLASDARNLPLITAAQTALTSAQTEYNRTRLTLEYHRQQAVQALQVADQVLDLTQQRYTAARENLELIQKSFDLGESDLFILLRTRSAAFEAEQAYNQQAIAQALARARLNQTQGVLP